MFESGWQQVEQACVKAGFHPKNHPVYADSMYECPFIDVAKDECFIIAYGSFSNGVAFNARPDLVLVPIIDECFHIHLFYNKEDPHPLLQKFIDYIRPFSPLEHCD